MTYNEMRRMLALARKDIQNLQKQQNAIHRQMLDRLGIKRNTDADLEVWDYMMNGYPTVAQILKLVVGKTVKRAA